MPSLLRVGPTADALVELCQTGSEYRASNTSSVTEGARLEIFPINVRTLVAVSFVRLVSQGRSECHAASSWIEIKPFLSPNSTIESRSADVAVRMQQVQSSV